MDAAEARTRRLNVQGLWNPGLSRPADVVGRLVAMQAQEFPYALWSVAARCAPDERPRSGDLNVDYDLGSLLRTHVLRPTWHFVTPDDARWLLTLTAPRVRQIERPYLEKLGIDSGLLTRALDVFANAVAGGRHRDRVELRDALPEAGIDVPNAALVHLLLVAELERVLISGVTNGKQRTYADFDERVAPTFVAGAVAFDRENALAELAGRFFATRGPASVKDMAVWSGLTLADCRTGLAAARDRAPGALVAVDVEGVECWMPPGDAPADPQGLRADLIQGYDEYAMSYTETRALIQPPGFEPLRVPASLMHPLLLNGVIAGLWKHTLRRTDARVELRPLAPLSGDQLAAIDTAVGEYGVYLGLPTTLELV